MTTPMDTTPGQAEAQPEAILSGAGRKMIEGRSLGQIAWMRFKRDKVAVAGGVVVILLVLHGRPGQADRVDLRPRPEPVPPEPGRPRPARPQGRLGRHQLEPPAGCRPAVRPGHAGPDHRGLVGVAAGRDRRHRPVERHRHGAGHHRRLLRRLGGQRDQPDDGHLPGLPAAALRHLDLGRAPGRRLRPERPAAAHLGADLRDRLLQLALHGPDRPRADAQPARARVRRSLPQPRAPAARSSSSGNCSPTWWRRSSSTRRC